MPEISIIIPAHNAAQHLRQTLDSVRAQTYEDWEIVAVDDGSTDNTWSILDASGPRVRALRNELAQGPAAARNRAIAAAAGRYVVFLDADDLIAPGYLASQRACMAGAVAAGRRVGIVTCDAHILDDDGYAPHTYREMLPDRDAPLTLDAILARNSIYISSLVPVEAGESVGWFDEELFGTEDFGLWLKLLESGFEAILNPEPLATYRRTSGSVSSDIVRQAINNRRAYGLALSRGGLDPAQRAIVRRAIRYNVAMEAIARVRFGEDRRRSILGLVRVAPLIVWIAVTHRELWIQWLAVLRDGRQVAAGRRLSR